MRILPIASPIAALVLIVGCHNRDDDDKNSTSSGSSGSAWLVGDDGEMMRLAADGNTAPYRLETDADLHAITCVGATGAWVVGAGGVVLSTDDSGNAWQQHDLGLTADLFAIAVSESTPARIVVAGDGVLVSRRGEGAFVSLHDGDLPWRSLALDEAGVRLLAVAEDGSIWRADGDAALTEVARFEDQTLAGIATAHTPDIAVVVGTEGFLARTADGGTHWEMVAVPTTRDLWAVRVSHDGDAIVAVGEAGVVVRIDESGTHADEQLDPALSLRGLHMHGTGRGQAVGDAGTTLVTTDFGVSWDPVILEVDTVLRGVDDLHVGGHW